jgi:hypothetical protein
MKSTNASDLISLFRYDPTTGLFSSRLNSMIVGVRRKTGYIQVKVHGVAYRAHRLAWLYVNGTWPTGQIDHINGYRADNRIDNLRDVSHSINMQNKREPHKNNRCGFLGVHRHGGRFLAQIKIGGVKTIVGYFDSPEEASIAYVEAKRKLHAGCTI